MRIAVWHNLPSGGGKRALYDHVRGLLARGHTVEAFCPQTADRNFLPLSAMLTEHVIDLAWPVPRRRTDTWQITLETERAIAAMDAHCRRAAAAIERGGFDVLFANACQFFRTTAIGRLTSIPSALYLGEPYRYLYEASPRLCWLAPPRRKRVRLGQRNLRAAFVDLRQIRNLRLQAREEVDNAQGFTSILVNSQYSRESVLRAYGLDSTVCYLGIDTGHFVDRHLEREDFVVGLGSLTREKNLNLAIEAVGAIAPPRPRLVWIGNIVDRTTLAAATELARSREVVFEPRIRIPDAAVSDLLNRARAMIYVPRLEPFGLAPLEANACGLPVIAVAEGGVRESIVDQVNGLLVEPDPRAIAAAIDRLRDRGLARTLGRNARRAVEMNWSLAAATDRIEGALARTARRA